MQLWTHHPEAFKVDADDLRIDHTCGTFWNLECPGFRYRAILPKLFDLVGSNQFLWCCTRRGKFARTSEAHDLVEWELHVPESAMIAVFRVSVWEDLIWSLSDDWSNLILTERPTVAADDINALVSVPLPKDSATRWLMKPLGSLVGY